MSDGSTALRPGPRHHHTRERVEYAIITPRLASKSDESLVALVSNACAEAFATFVPGAELPVLADEFLSAGSSLSISHQVEQRGVSAKLIIRVGMRSVEATLHAGDHGYQVLRAKNDDWKDLLGSMTVSSRRIGIRANLRRGHGGPRDVRRFVVDLKSNTIVQKWEFTGPGGAPIEGTALQFK